MKSFRTILLLCGLALLLVFLGCSRSIKPKLGGPNIGKGPGGPAKLIGEIIVPLYGGIPRDVKLNVYRSTDYDSRLALVAIDLSDRSFRIIDLPPVNVDIIITQESGVVLNKKSNIKLEEGENFVSISLANLPEYVPGEVVVSFKDTTIVDSVAANKILREYDCSVKQVSSFVYSGRHSFTVDIPDDKTVPEMVSILALDDRIFDVHPNYLYHPN